MIRKCILYIAISLLFSGPLVSQYYNTGQDPASLKWEQLNTDHFRFIFPTDYRKEALRTARIFEDAYKLTGGRYGEDLIRKFPVIIHNHSVTSNGYVAWAPKRVEIYPAPGQNSIPLFHTSQLALHELIHVSQMQALKQGLSRPLEYVFGEQFSGALAVFTPYWFLEGEAVVSESQYSHSGRGRQPDFEKSLKAMLLDKESIKSYDKLLEGSYKDYTPNHYQFGYQMTAYTLEKYGDEVFPSVLENISRKPYTLNPFNISLKRNTGLSKKQLFDTTMDYLYTSWSKADSLLVKSKFHYYDEQKGKEYISYHSPHSVGKDSIIALKTSLGEPPAFVLISNNGLSEKKIFSPGYVWPYRFSVAWPLITWAENVDDPRWANRSYSLIKTLNVKSGLAVPVSKRSRLFSPSLSPDGRMIAASESSTDYTNKLVIIENYTGKRISEHETPQNVLVVNPRWSGDNRVAFVSSGEAGEGIMVFDPEKNLFEERLGAGSIDIQSVALRNDTIFYIASHSGINNIYRINPDRSVSRLSSSRFGLSDLSFYGNDFLFSDYTSKGYRVGSFASSISYEQIDPSTTREPILIKKIDSSGKLPYYFDYVNDTLNIKAYRKWQHLFNFHSWMPFYTDINNISFENLSISPGLTLMSQNHLSTLTSSVGYEYLDGDHLLHTSLLWEGQYPSIEFDISYGGSTTVIQDADSLYYPSKVNNGLRASANIYLPLRFSSGRFYQAFYPSLRLTYLNRYIYEEESGVFDYGQLFTTARLYFANLHRMSHRDIWPRWGQVIDLSATWVPGDRDKYGPVKSLRTTFYAPGLLPNNGLKLMFQAEKQDFEKYPFLNRVTLPRGYKHSSFISQELISWSADYTMPLIYPDINIGSLAYLKRIRTTLFYDYSTGTGNYYPARQEIVEEKESFSSIGAELLADFYLLRMPFGFTGGIQSAWLPEEQKPYFGLILNIDVFGFAIGKNPGLPY